MNEITCKDAYPLPRIDDTLETLSQSQLFSTLDLASGKWNLQISPRRKQLSVFYEFKLMPLELCNALVTYIHDIIVMGKTFQEYLKHMEQSIQEAGLKVKTDKCFLREHVRYLGHIVSKNCIKADPDKTKSSTGHLRGTSKKSNSSWDLRIITGNSSRNLPKLPSHYTS